LVWLVALGLLSCARRELLRSSKNTHILFMEISPLAAWDGNIIAQVGPRIVEAVKSYLT
jgi:hypothetical protein